MDIIVNGKAREIQDGICIQELLDQMQLDCMQLVVEHNKNIIPRHYLTRRNSRHNGILDKCMSSS